MPLETGTLIPELDENNPLGSDGKNQGDDHLRLLKRCVTGSFPAFVGTTAVPKSVTLTEDQINDAALKSVDQTIIGEWTFPNVTRFSGNSCRLIINEADGGVDEKNWRILANTNRFFLETLDDAESLGANIMDVRRTGIAIDSVTCGGAWIFSAESVHSLGLVVPNNQAYRATELGGIDRFIAFMDPSDVIQWGNPNNNAVYEAVASHTFNRQAAELASLDITGLILPLDRALQGPGGITVAQVATGNVVTFGSTGNNSVVQAFSQMNMEIGGNEIGIWNDSALNLRNSIQITGRNFADNAWLGMVQMNANDQLLIGSTSSAQTLLFLDSPIATTIRLRIGGIEAARIDSIAAGGLLITDLNGARKKAGFRNPSFRSMVGATNTQQGDEGQGIEMNATPIALTVVDLETNTQIDVINNGNGANTIVEDALLTLSWLDGSGTIQTGTRTIQNGSIVHLRQRGANDVQIWGNGLS